MKTACISLKTLYEHFGEDLACGTIEYTNDNGSEYWDLRNGDSIILCMDGESCEVVFHNDRRVELINRDGEIDTKFILSKEEFEIATFNM